MKDVDEFRFDVTQLTRQLLGNLFTDLYDTLVATFTASTSTAVEVSSAGQVLLDLLHDIDTLLFTNEHFLLSTWITDARHWASGNESYAAYLEYNARNQITLWGPAGENNDYASKQWAGLVGTYYVKRWQTFVSYLVGLKESGEAYNATLVADTMFSIGETWSKQTLSGTTGTKGETFDVVDTLLKRWA